MADFDSNRFKSKSQVWETPDSLFNRLNNEFRFTCDVAATESNRKCLNHIDNATVSDWYGSCWLNPPYGDSMFKLKDWVQRAYQQASTGNCRVVILIPARTNTKWWHDYCMQAEEIRFICGRPKFKGCVHGLPQPLAIVIFSSLIGQTKVSSYNA